MRSSIVFYILHLGILLCDVMHAAPFSNNSYIEEYEGREVTLSCWKELSLRPTDIDWMKKAEVPTEKRVATKLLSGKINYFGPWNGEQVILRNDNSLKIKRLEYPRDQGTFTCNGHKISSVTVNILSNPQSVDISGSWVQQGVRYLNVTHGKTVTVDCFINGGKPPSSYSWRLEDRDITLTSFQQSLTYTFNKSNNGQTLRCITGSGVQGNARLNVHYAPSTPAMIANKGLNFEVIEDEDVTLKCDSNGNPAPFIKWLRAGLIIGLGDQYNISKAKRSDAGTYICRASNIVDTSENQKQLVIKYPPAVSLVYRPDQLSCEASNGHPQDYKFEPWTHKVGGMIVPVEARSTTRGNTLVLDLSNVTYRSSGDYLCIVTNGVKGRQTSTKQIQATGPPAFGKQPRVFKAKISERVDVPIKFWSNPFPTKVMWREKDEGNGHGQWVPVTTRINDVPVKMEFGDFTAPLKGHEAVITVQTFEEADFGPYTVWVKNAKGSATYDIKIIAEGDDRVVILIAVLSFASLIIIGITLMALIRFNIISCPAKRIKTSTPEPTRKSADLDIGHIRQVDPCPSQSRQSVQLSIPKNLRIKVTGEDSDQRYMPMGSPPVTPVLPDSAQRLCDIEDYVRANTVQASAPPITEVSESAYEDVIYANEAVLMKEGRSAPQ